MLVEGIQDWDTLPNELLIKIFEHLSSCSDSGSKIGPLLLLSKSWQATAKDLLRSLHLSRTDVSALEAIGSFRNLTSLRATCQRSAVNLAPLSKLAQLTCLTLEADPVRCQRREIMDFYIDLRPLPEGLKELELNQMLMDPKVHSGIQSGASLTKLRFYFHAPSGANVADLLRHFPALKVGLSHSRLLNKYLGGSQDHAQI